MKTLKEVIGVSLAVGPLTDVIEKIAVNVKSFIFDMLIDCIKDLDQKTRDDLTKRFADLMRSI